MLSCASNGQSTHESLVAQYTQAIATLGYATDIMLVSWMLHPMHNVHPKVPNVVPNVGAIGGPKSSYHVPHGIPRA